MSRRFPHFCGDTQRTEAFLNGPQTEETEQWVKNLAGIV
jgi:hypothetical protein